MAIKVPQTLITALVNQGVVTQEDAKSSVALAQQENRDVGQVLVEKGFISDEDLVALKSQLYRLPAIRLSDIELNHEAVKEISDEVIHFYRIVPFAREGSVLKVGILNPEDISALEALKFIAADKGLALEKYIIGYRDYDSVLRKSGSLTGDVGKALEGISPEEAGVQQEVAELRFEQITAESPVTKVVSSILKHGIDSRGSDIHIEPFEDRVRVRFRVDGILATTLTLPKALHSAVVTRIKILSDLKIDETRLAQDGRFSIKMPNGKVDFRVSTFPTKYGEKAVMRILTSIESEIELENLGVEGLVMEMLVAAMNKPFGSILMTGPTGSGKSTTIVGILKKLNTEEVNVVTLEDPVEYYIDGVNQSQVHEEIGYTFANGLRHILRQDPDIIMVGEIRDQETAALATQAALTGHLVLSTLHTNDSLGVIPRLVDMKVERYLIPPTLNLAMAQRLLRRLCPTCKLETKANSAEEKIITEALQTMPKEYQEKYLSKGGYTIYKPNTENPCRECGGKAFRGRIGIFEAMQMTSELEKTILGDLSEAALQQEFVRQGMTTMFQDGIQKVLRGVVSLEELLEVAQAGESA